MTKESYKDSEQQISTICHDAPRQISRQHKQCALGMATITRNQSEIFVISLWYLGDSRHSLTILAGSSQFRLMEIIKPNDPRANWSKMIEAKYSEIRYLSNRGSLRAVLRAELPDSANMITERYFLSVNQTKEKKNAIRQSKFLMYTGLQWKKAYSIELNRPNAYWYA